MFVVGPMRASTPPLRGYAQRERFFRRAIDDYRRSP